MSRLTERLRRRAWLPALGLVAASVAACESPPLHVPTAEQVESYYDIPSRSTVEMNGNVAEIEVTQSADHLRRGGRLWAQVGPYVYLFTDATQQLFTDWNGLAAVRVTTLAPSGEMVARATLTRDALNSITWKRALNISGHARKSGTTQLTRLEDLVEWGEDHTDHEYNPDYAAVR